MHIRIVSPSATMDHSLIDKAADVLKSWGHEVSLGKNCKCRYGGAAGTPEERLQDLNEAYADPTVDAILCSRGGYGLAQIIDKVIVNKHKLLMGFSDITCLHCLNGINNIPSLHSIMAKHIATLPSDSEPLLSLKSILDGNDVHYNLNTSPYSRLGEMSGVLRGGNLSVFYGLQGTPYQVIKENTILFIEDISEPQYHIDRMLQNLRMSGLLESLKGIIVGQFADCEDDPRLCCTLKETILRAVEPYDYPVLFDFPAGHVDYNLPVFMNTMTHVAIENETTSLLQWNPFIVTQDR